MKIENLLRENIKKLKPYSSARSIHNSGILIDANENPFGSVVDYKDIKLNRYPDSNQIELRTAIAGYLDLELTEIFCGVGSDEIIDLLIRIFCRPGIDNILTMNPSYGMYEVSANINDVEVRKINLKNDFTIDVAEIKNNVNENTKIIFLCSPNNPTGNIIEEKVIDELCSSINAVVVVDEAYIDFCEDSSVIKKIKQYNNLFVLRTFSKAWGLAGLRCGYCAGAREIIEVLMNVKAPYNVNAITTELIISATKNTRQKNIFVQKIITEREKLINELGNFKSIIKIEKSDANFIIIKIKNATSIYKQLAMMGLIVRDRSKEYLLEDCLRVSIGNRIENDMLLQALGEIL